MRTTRYLTIVMALLLSLSTVPSLASQLADADEVPTLSQIETAEESAGDEAPRTEAIREGKPSCPPGKMLVCTPGCGSVTCTCRVIF